jgi:hypothetical protein
MGYIFEAEIESIIHAVRVKTIGEDDDVFLKKILSANIHPAIQAYFKAEVEKTLSQERGSEYRSKKFSYSLAEVKSLEEQIDLLLVQNYHFGLQEFESILDESVHFHFNYLCRPQWTLLNFIVGDKRRVASSTIEKRLKYCIDYTYFPELIKRFLVDHGLAEVTYEEFKSLIEKIDHEVVAQHSSFELAQITRALFDFVESGKMVPQVEFEQQTLPINAAIVFFDDKHLTDIRVRLEFERDHNRIIQITADRLADIIEIVRVGHEDATARPITLPMDTPDDIPLLSKEVADQSNPTLFDNAASQEQKAGSDAQATEDSEASKTPSIIFGEDDQKIFATMPGAKRKEILDLLSEKERRLIVRKLFFKDESAFQGAVTEISILETWDSVAQYLEMLFRANEADPFSKVAILFTDKLFAYYHSSSAEGYGRILHAIY